MAKGLELKERSGRFSLKLGALLQFRYEASDSDNPDRRSRFLTRMVRPQLRGNLLVPWIRFFVQPELGTSQPKLLDLEVDFVPHEAIGLRAGQFLTPFSRAFLTPVPKLQFPDFSVANDAFRAGRDTGAMLFGRPFGGLLEYDLAVFNGNGIDKDGNDDDLMLWMGRLALNPLGALPYDEVPGLEGSAPFRVALGVNGYVSGTRKTLGADLAASWHGFTLLAEVFRRTDSAAAATASESFGAYVQLGALLFEAVELCTRASVVDLALGTPSPGFAVYEGLANTYLAKHQLKVGLLFLHREGRAETDGEGQLDVLSLQLQLFI